MSALLIGMVDEPHQNNRFTGRPLSAVHCGMKLFRQRSVQHRDQSDRPPFHSPALPEASNALPKRSFIDMHCHTAGIGAGGSGCFVSPRMEKSFRFKHYLKSFDVARAQVEQAGDGLILKKISEQIAQSRYVGQAVVLALDGVVDAEGTFRPDQTEVYVPNEYVGLEVAKYPNLLFGASVNPYRRDALARLAWSCDHDAVLVKWLPAIQTIDPADERIVPFYRKLTELRLPLLTHTGPEHSFTRAENALSDPARLRLPLSLGVTVIAAHAGTGNLMFGGERSVDRLGRLATEFPNLYADISALTLVNRLPHLREVIARPEFKGRLLYGTDYPLSAMPALVSPWYSTFRFPIRQISRIARVANSWDRDVLLKHALGVPSDVWTRGESVLRLGVSAGKLER